MKRVDDPSWSIWAYLYDPAGVWVACPSCSGPARVMPEIGKGGHSEHTAQLTCTCCLYRAHSAPPTNPNAPLCHGCGTRISVEQPLPKRKGVGLGPPNRRQGCGLCKRLKCGQDPYFGLQFFMRSDVGGREIWAINRRHLRDMAVFIRARLRERNPAVALSLTAMARLPAWMKTAHMRPRILHA